MREYTATYDTEKMTGVEYTYKALDDRAAIDVAMRKIEAWPYVKIVRGPRGEEATPEDVVYNNLGIKRHTYDIQFDSQRGKERRGWRVGCNACMKYIDNCNGRGERYMTPHKGGYVSIVCNETNEIVYITKIK